MKFLLVILVFNAAIFFSGCAERAASDNYKPGLLSPDDERILSANRYSIAGGGAIVRVQYPAYVYRNGALVDTGGVNWFYLGRNAVFFDTKAEITGPPGQSSSSKIPSIRVAPPTEAPKGEIHSTVSEPRSTHTTDSVSGTNHPTAPVETQIPSTVPSIQVEQRVVPEPLKLP